MTDGLLYAHSVSSVSRLRHTLEDHLRGSAFLARRFGHVFGAGDLASYLALVHDVGKGACVWQDKLQVAERHGGKVGVPHKHAGTWLVSEYLPWQFGSVVFGHHGGLPDLERLRAEVKKAQSGDQVAVQVAEAVRRVERVVPEIHPDPRPVPPSWLTDLPPAAGKLGLDLLLRMLFSCVVDADFLDTQAHFAGDGSARVREPADMGALVERYEARRVGKFSGRERSVVGEVRQRVYEQACAAAENQPGMYVLHVPTGGAKTIAAGGFALRHAAAHGMRRVVVAVPFISVTEQNAAVYRELLDPEPGTGEEPVVLEHHSAVDLDAEVKRDGLTEEQVRRAEDQARTAKLAAENWDAPFVVTTTVRLFESLFSHKPSAMRRLHNLAGSVIVLDEVQALPDRLLTPILSALRGLVEHFGVTVVLASATQPSLWNLEGWNGLERREVVDDPGGLFEVLRRVRYEWRTGEDVTLEIVAADAARHRQALTVVGATKDAAYFHRCLTEEAGPGTEVLHLSTRMSAGHRREIITRIKDLLDKGAAVQVVSTSLIEAGVDLDFPRVYRAWAPPESLQQAAGRCNRDGRLPGHGTVVVFRASDARQPADASYKAAVDAGGHYIGPGLADPDDLKALGRYYPLRYRLQQAAPGSGLGEEIEELRRSLNFPEVDRNFQMIEDGLHRPVIVIRTEEEREAIESAVRRLRAPYPPCGPEVLRSLQDHIASLPRREAEEGLRDGLAEAVIGDLLLWTGAYHPRRGLDPEEKEDRGSYSF